MPLLRFDDKIRQRSLVIVPDGIGFGLHDLILVEVHHLLLGGDQVQLEGRLQLDQFLQEEAEDELVGQGVDALDGVDQLQRGLLRIFEDFLHHVSELLRVLLGLLGLVLRHHADQQLLVGTALGDHCLVEGFWVGREVLRILVMISMVLSASLV